MTGLILYWAIRIIGGYIGLLVLTSFAKIFLYTKFKFSNQITSSTEARIEWDAFENDQYLYALVPFLNIYWKHKLAKKIEAMYNNTEIAEKIRSLDSSIFRRITHRSDMRAILSNDRQREVSDELVAEFEELIYFAPLLFLLVAFFM